MKFRYLTSTILSVALAATVSFARTGNDAPQQRSMAPFTKKRDAKVQMTPKPLPSPLPQTSASRRTRITDHHYVGAEVGLTSGTFTGNIAYTFPYPFTVEGTEAPSYTVGDWTEHSPAFGFSVGAVADFALSQGFGVQTKLGFKNVASTGTRKYSMQCLDPNGVAGTANMEEEYLGSVSYLGIDALARVQFAEDGIYGLAGVGFGSVLSFGADVRQTVVSSDNGCQYLDNFTNPTGFTEMNVNGGEYKDNINSTRLDARLGVGTWIPMGDNGMVIVPELTVGIPVTPFLTSDLEKVWKDGDRDLPNLLYANLTVGIKFPWGDINSGDTPVAYDNSSGNSSTSDRSTPEAGKAMLSGRVVDNAGRPIDDAQVTVVDLNNNEVVATDETDNGMYNVKVNTPGRYSVTADAPGYLFGSALFEVDKDGRILKSSGDIKLSPSADGRVRLLVFFDFDKATLQSSSYPELNRAVALMKSNPSMQVEIAGFTDAQGTDSYNKDLSQRRANSVREYLVRQGIEGSRLTAMGYGEANPVATNDTEDGRAENRRVEFVVKRR